MTANDSAADKSTVDELNFGAKTSKRVTWEAWEFTIEAPHLVRVTNASYGIEKDDHSYLVGVEDRDGLLVPAECECPADMYHEEYDCKHKVALAVIGGPVVLEASVNFPTGSDQLCADGGTATEESDGESNLLNGAKYYECDCANLCDDLPCWPCVRTGERTISSRR